MSARGVTKHLRGASPTFVRAQKIRRASERLERALADPTSTPRQLAKCRHALKLAKAPAQHTAANVALLSQMRRAQ